MSDTTQTKQMKIQYYEAQAQNRAGYMIYDLHEKIDKLRSIIKIYEESLEYYFNKEYHSERYEDGTLQYTAQEALEKAKGLK